MSRKRDFLLWDQFDVSNGVSKCKHCKAEFRGNPSAARLTNHLLGVKNGGIRICKKVPPNVKEELADVTFADVSRKRPRIEHGSSSNIGVTNSISTSEPQQNDVSKNPVPKEHYIYGRLENNVELDCEGLDTPLPDHDAHDAVVDGSYNRPQIEPSSTNNEVTNLTSAAQPNSGFENPVQIGERIQDRIVQGAEDDNLAGVHSREDMTGCNTIEGHDALNQTKSNSLDELRCSLDEMETRFIWDQFELLNDVTNSISVFAPQQNDAFVCQIEPGSSSNDVINITSAAQPNGGFENAVQIGERNQDRVVQVAEHVNLAEVHSREDMIGCNTIEEHGAHNQNKANSWLRKINEIQRKLNELKHCLIPNEAMEGNVPEANSDFALENQVQGEERMEEEFRGRNEDLPGTNEELLPTTDLVGQAFETNMNIIWEWSMGNTVSSIGIHGMGGVGKTTLVKHIYNRILKNPLIFNNVYWVTVSQDFSIERLQNPIASIERLQNRIAEVIGLSFEDEKNVLKRAAKLSIGLRRKCKFVLILDDLWDHFDVKKVGIPVGVDGLDGCKLIITTRSLEVCRQTNCQGKVKVEPLLENEAWKLFSETLGHDLAPGIKQIARSIARECGRLPLGIVTMAGSMREVDDIHEWNNALTELQNAEVRKDDMDTEVFRILRYSYTRLNDPKLQKCLLYCALYPEDFEIPRDELIKHLVVERIIERRNSREASHDKGQTMLNKLVNVSLLEGIEYTDGYRAVKMHDLIRDMAIQKMRECSPSSVRVGEQLTSLPEHNWWMEDTVRVSLMNNYFEEISFNRSPNCPNLSTLLLCNNNRLKSICESFFHQLCGLKVLNLCDTMIDELPESLAGLKNLTALLLGRCRNLTYVPSLSKLVALEVLDFYECEKLEKVPDGLESLFNLNYLNLLFSGVTKLPSRIFSNLSHLQFLAFHYSSEIGVKAKDVGCLSNLETLYLIFNDQGDFRDFNNDIHSILSIHTESQHIILLVGSTRRIEHHIGRMLYNRKCGQDLYFCGCTVSREVHLPKYVQRLLINDVSIEDGRGLCLKNAIDLKKFTIYWCEEMEYLFCLSSEPLIFRSLEIVYVFEMEKLRGLFGGEGDDGAIPIPLPPNDAFCCLKVFTLHTCPNMKKLFPSGLLSNLRSLEELEVYDCSEMKEIIALEEEEKKEDEGRSNTHFTLPKLRLLQLKKLPKLTSICIVKLKCDSLQEIFVHECLELKKIRISHRLSSLKNIEVSPEKWWESVEWGDFNHKLGLSLKMTKNNGGELHTNTILLGRCLCGGTLCEFTKCTHRVC